MEGKPWSPELEKELTDLVAAKTSLFAITKKLGKPEEAVRLKIHRLGLEVVEHTIFFCSTTSSLFTELPSVEEMLKKLVVAVGSLETCMIPCLFV